MPATKLRSPFVATLGASAVALVGACSNPPPATDCPTKRPAQGAPCRITETCSYEDSCGNTVVARCRMAKWEVEVASCNPPPPPGDTCPTNEPVVGASCSVASYRVCMYRNLCPLPGATSQKVHNWRCTAAGKWMLEGAPKEPLDCPKGAPAEGDPCACAPYLPATCNYSSACGELRATCDGATQRWKVSAPVCSDAGVDATSDAPANVDAPATDGAPLDAPATDDASSTDAPAGSTDAPAGSTDAAHE